MPDPAVDETRRLRARIAAHESWANTTDRSGRTAPARAALEARFLEQADGDPIRAAHLRKAHFARMALRSAQARRSRRVAAEANEADTGYDTFGGGAA